MIAETAPFATDYELHIAGDNTFPECACCAFCCMTNVICASAEEVARMREYMLQHQVVPIDYHKTRCCFSGPDKRCMIWEARPQICRLHNCRVPRKEILRQHPEIVIDENKPLIDLHDTFITADTCGFENRLHPSR